jgi:hypothetical protein
MELDDFERPVCAFNFFSSIYGINMNNNGTKKSVCVRKDWKEKKRKEKKEGKSKKNKREINKDLACDQI